MSLRAVTLAALALPLLLAAGCDRQSGADKQPAAAPTDAVPAGTPDRSHSGEAAPALTFHGDGGTTLSLAAPTGKPRLVNFWATWCAPCIAELPALHRLSASSGLSVVAINQDIGDAAKVRSFWAAHGMAGWGLWLDPDGQASTALHLNNLPETILYDAAGKEVWRVEGPRDWTDAASAKLLAEAK